MPLGRGIDLHESRISLRALRLLANKRADEAEMLTQ